MNDKEINISKCNGCTIPKDEFTGKECYNCSFKETIKNNIRKEN